MQALEAGKPGAWTGQVLSRVVEWQLEHPEGTRDQCIAWLQAERAVGKIDLNADISAGKRGQDAATSLNSKKAKR